MIQGTLCLTRGSAAPHKMAIGVGTDLPDAARRAIATFIMLVAMIYPHVNGIGGDEFWLNQNEERAAVTISSTQSIGHSRNHAVNPQYKIDWQWNTSGIARTDTGLPQARGNLLGMEHFKIYAVQQQKPLKLHMSPGQSFNLATLTQHQPSFTILGAFDPFGVSEVESFARLQSPVEGRGETFLRRNVDPVT